MPRRELLPFLTIFGTTLRALKSQAPKLSIQPTDEQEL
jgi:hypothetical protein